MDVFTNMGFLDNEMLKVYRGRLFHKALNMSGIIIGNIKVIRIAACNFSSPGAESHYTCPKENTVQRDKII